MERSTPMSASRVEITPLHSYAENKSTKLPLTDDELFAKLERELDALNAEYSSPEAVDNGTDALSEIAQLADVTTMTKMKRTSKVRDGLDHVAELRRCVEDAREEAEPALPIEIREERLRNMEQQHKDMVDDILRNTARTAELRQHRDSITSEYETVKQRVEELQKEADEGMSYKAYLLNIIMRVTATSVVSTKNSEQVSGVVKSDVKNLVPFTIEKNNVGDFESVNHLWSLITDDDTGHHRSGE